MADRILTILLGSNQDFTAAEAILAKYGATRIEPTDAVMNNQSIEAAIDPSDWRVITAELQYKGYDFP